MTKTNNKVKYTLLLPANIWKILDSHLSIQLQNIGNTKSRNTYRNCWWNMISIILTEYWSQDNKFYFKNIRHAKFQNLLGQQNGYISKIKTAILNTQVFQTNQSYSKDKGFALGYRLNPDLVPDYILFKKSIKKRLSNTVQIDKDLNLLPNTDNKIVKITYQIKDKINLNQITNKLNLNTNFLPPQTDSKLNNRNNNNNKLNNNNLINNNNNKEQTLKPIDYIKCWEDSHFIDQKYTASKEQTKNIYGDENTMLNEWEKTMLKRTEQITVDLKALWDTYQDSYFLQEWILKIHNAEVTGDRHAVFKHGRIYYNPFWSNLPSHLRHACRWRGYRVWEIFDVKNCFATLSLKLLEGKVSEDEYQKYKMIVKNGIYEAIAATTGEYDRDDVKQPFCHWLFANSSVKKRALDPIFILVRDYFKNEFPQIYDYFLNYPQVEYIDQFGVKARKSRLSVDCQWMQNKLVMNNLAKWVQQTYDVEVLTLHDSIWVKGDDWLKVDRKAIIKKWYEIMAY